MSKSSKPEKPHPGFPLFPHDNGQWAKKVNRKLHYFGPWRDPDAALAAYEEFLRTGRRPGHPAGLTVEDLCNHFLHFKHELVDSGELSPRTWERYKGACLRIVEVLGRHTAVADLAPADFQRLRTTIAKRYSPAVTANEIQMVRSVFRYGFDAELIDKPVRFGPAFKKPSAKSIRASRASKGERMFTPAEIRRLLDVSTANMRAMVLLAINGGLGNTDVAMMPMKAVDLDGGWLNYPRPKTSIPRKIPLWPETVDAVRQVLKSRGTVDTRGDDLLFVGTRGENYVGKHRGYRVTQEFKRCCRKANISGRTFYDLRRTFQTVSEDACDLVATQAIMGHAPSNSDMSAIYRQRVPDERLQAVVETVRRWLFEDPPGDGEQPDVVRFPSAG